MRRSPCSLHLLWRQSHPLKLLIVSSFAPALSLSCASTRASCTNRKWCTLCWSTARTVRSRSHDTLCWLTMETVCACKDGRLIWRPGGHVWDTQGRTSEAEIKSNITTSLPVTLNRAQTLTHGAASFCWAVGSWEIMCEAQLKVAAEKSDGSKIFCLFVLLSGLSWSCDVMKTWWKWGRWRNVEFYVWDHIVIALHVKDQVDLHTCTAHSGLSHTDLHITVSVFSQNFSFFIVEKVERLAIYKVFSFLILRNREKNHWTFGV